MFQLSHFWQLASMLVIWQAVVAVADERPNFVFMLSDDQNWSGTSVAMHPDVAASKSTVIQTPALERLAAAGMRFSAAYAPAPVCSPTRCSLQLGQSPAQTGWTKAAPTVTAADGYRLIPPRISKTLSHDTTTIAEVLRSAGYATAHYGKWHLNGGGPSQHGYDDGDGATGNEYAYRFRPPNPVDIFGMARRCEQFMARSQAARKPFFIQLSWHALHAPENALPETVAKYARIGGRVPRAAAISEDLDTGVGRVLGAIERLGLTNNTYVIYMSDNGGGRHGALQGGKGSLMEAGIRVPLIVRGPGVAPNSWCHTTVVGYDFFPTFCELASIPQRDLPIGLEGGSLVSVLTNNGTGNIQRPRAEVVFHFPHYQSAGGPHSALILGNLKLLKYYEDNRLMLFDLSRDMQERQDLAQTLPRETKQLHDRLVNYLAAVKAQLPIPNPQFRLSGTRQGTSPRRRRPSPRRPKPRR